MIALGCVISLGQRTISVAPQVIVRVMDTGQWFKITSQPDCPSTGLPLDWHRWTQPVMQANFPSEPRTHDRLQCTASCVVRATPLSQGAQSVPPVRQRAAKDPGEWIVDAHLSHRAEIPSST